MDAPSEKARQIADELQAAEKALDQRKRELDASRASYERAMKRYENALDYLREEFQTYKTIGADETAFLDWMVEMGLGASHLFTGMALGRAIIYILGHIPEKEEGLELKEIVKELTEGGYHFQTSSPLRETNAALINLKQVGKAEDQYTLVEEEEDEG